MKILFLLLFSGLCSLAQAQSVVLGSKPEVLDADMSAAPPPAVSTASFTISSGGTRTFGPGPLVSASGHSYSYYWACQEGSLAALNAENSHVRYIAPLVTVTTQDRIYIWIGSSSGRATEGFLDVTVTPSGSTPPPSVGQLSGSYLAGSGVFSLNYQLNATATRAWIFSSLDGSTWSQALALDPVTVANRSGTPTVSVSGSSGVTTVYFKLRTQVGTAAAQEGEIIALAYSPPVAVPKSTELPLAPTLYINGIETTQPQAALIWTRVNDSQNQDNAVSYQVERATNASFSGSTILSAPNTAPGLNMYETISYTASGLADNTTYYFRTRALNNVGTGAWSNAVSIRVNIQERPVFNASPHFPAHLASGVTKMPALECQVTDPEGDGFYCAFEIAESPSGPWRYFGHGGQQAYLNVSRLDPAEWVNPLKPNTHYFWRAIAHEEGRNLDYYGGTWPTSPVWEFTTENVGPAFAISSVTHLSGTLKIGEILTYRVTVVNNGNEASSSTLVQAFYVKSGVENRFAYAGWGLVPALAPGASIQTDVSLMFRSDLLTTSDGSVLDNILVTGTSTLRFKTFPEPTALSTAIYNYTLNYVNAGGPTVIAQARGPGTNNPYAPIGGKFTLVVEANDDIRTTRVLLEYRTNPAAPWVTIDDYTGNIGTRMIFPDSTHSGPTVPWGQNAVDWIFPAAWGPTSTLQVRATAYDDVGAYTVAVTSPMTIYDNTFAVSAKAVQFPAYRLGDTVSVPLSLTRAAGANVTNIQVFYYATPTGPYSILYNETSPSQYDSLTVPPVLSVTLPTADAYASSTAFLRVTLRGVVPGIASLNSSDDSDGTFTTSVRDLPAPFHTAVLLFSGTYTAWPTGAWGTNEWDEATVLDWEGDTRVHALVQQQYSYLLTDTNGSTNSYQGNVFHHSVYDRTTGVVTTVPLPAGYSADDLKVYAGTPYVLLRNGTGLYWSWKSGSSFVTPQFLLNLVSTFTTTPEFVTRNGELLVAYTTRNNTSGGGTAATWRNRLQRVLPSLGSTLEHGSYLGSHLDYGSSYLNGDSGLYALNSGGSITSTLKTWSGNLLWFSSANSSIVGAAQTYENGHQVLDFYSPAAVATRWNIDVQEPRVRVFSDVALAVGQGTTSSPPGEDNYKVVIRRNLTTGVEDRIHFGSWGQGYSTTGRHSAVSDGRWVAVNWNRLLAVGNLSADLVAPTVAHVITDSTFTNGVSKNFTWTLSDNLNQLASLKVIRIAGGIATTLANYTSAPLPTSASFTLNESAGSVVLRLEAYDTAGNRGVAETTLMQNRTFTLDSFTATSYSLPSGSNASLSWTSTPADAFRIYSLLLRPVGGTSWTSIASVTGNTFALDTALLSGSYELQLESGGVTRTLAQTLTVTGERFTFDNAAFSPVSGTAYYLSNAPSLQLSWGSNQPESTATAYTVLGRWNGSGNYAVLGSGTSKTLTISPGSNTQLEWKVSAMWQGLEFVSGVKNIALAALSTPTAPTATPGGRDSATPFVDLAWPSIAGAAGYVVFRRDVITGSIEEIGRPETASLRDDSIGFDQPVAYAIATVLVDSIGTAGTETALTLTPLLPLGISFVNSQYQLLSANVHTVSWTPLLPAGVASVFQDYEVILRTGDGVYLAKSRVTPASGATPAIYYTSLPFQQSFVCEVYALTPTGARISPEPVRLHFSTALDTRSIATPPVVTTPLADASGMILTWEAAPNADSYDIYRRTTATGSWVWIGRSTTTAYTDTSLPSGSGAAYLVRARNSNTVADAAATTAVPFGAQTNFRITSGTMISSGQDFRFDFNTQYGATYQVQHSSDLQNWLPLGTAFTGTGAPQSITATGVGAQPKCFFRVVKP